jgi:hypothetical protein
MDELRQRFGKVAGISILDLGGTLVIAYGISRYQQWPFIPTALGTIAVGEVAHILVQQSTPVTAFIESLPKKPVVTETVRLRR